MLLGFIDEADRKSFCCRLSISVVAYFMLHSAQDLKQNTEKEIVSHWFDVFSQKLNLRKLFLQHTRDTYKNRTTCTGGTRIVKVGRLDCPKLSWLPCSQHSQQTRLASLIPKIVGNTLFSLWAARGPWRLSSVVFLLQRQSSTAVFQNKVAWFNACSGNSRIW